VLHRLDTELLFLFHRLSADGTHDALVRAFLAFGAESAEFRAALGAAERHRWRER